MWLKGLIPWSSRLPTFLPKEAPALRDGWRLRAEGGGGEYAHRYTRAVGVVFARGFSFVSACFFGVPAGEEDMDWNGTNLRM